MLTIFRLIRTLFFLLAVISAFYFFTTKTQIISVYYLLVWIIWYFWWQKFLRAYYLSRNLFHYETSWLFTISLILISSYLIQISTKLFDHNLNFLAFTLVHLVFLLGIFFSFIIANILIFFRKPITKKLINKEQFNLLIKTICPYHRYFISLWNSAYDPSFAMFLLSIEPDAVDIDERIKGLIITWLELGVISPLSCIQAEYRGEYLFLHEEQAKKNNHQFKSSEILDIEKIIINDQELKLTVRLTGKISLSDLVTGKNKEKLIEFFALQGKYLRSLDIEAYHRQLHFQFLTFPEDLDPLVIATISNIDIAFTELNIKSPLHQYPQLNNYFILDEDKNTKTVYSVCLEYKLPQGLSVEVFNNNKISSLAAFVRKPFYKHKIKPHEEIIQFFIDLAPRDFKQIKYTDFPPAKGLHIPVGFDLMYHQPVFINLDASHYQNNDPGITPHVIIAGTTGSGKSSFIKYLIVQLIRGHTPDSLRLFLVDPKVVTFSVFSNLPFLYAPIIADAKKFKIVIEGVRKEVEKRYEILAKYQVEKLIDLKEVAPDIAKTLPYIIVIIDEFADIIDSHNWKIREDINLLLKRLGQKARAAGVHIILITQRATSSNIDSEIKANISGRIAFKVASESDSQIMIEDNKSAFIERSGEAFAKLGDSNQLTHFQAPLVNNEELILEINQFANWPLNYLDKTLTEELLREPLAKEEVAFSLLGTVNFPKIPIGINLVNHQVVYLQFEKMDNEKDEACPHLIIAGATNTGKSKFVKVILSQLISAGSPDLIKIVLIDPKHVTFRKFLKAPHLACPVITKHHLLLPILENILQIIEDRYILFAKNNCENIEDYRLKTKLKLASYFLIIDEFADLLDFYNYKDREKIEKILKRYGQMARAAGIHLIIIVQRASGQNIPNELRANFSGKIAFRVNTEADSFYILEQNGAEKLESAGMFYLKQNDQAISKAYAPLMHGPEFTEIVNQAINKWGEAKFAKFADIVEKEVLDISDVTSEMLPDPYFPNIPIGINLQSHKIVFIRWARAKDSVKEEPTPHLLIAGATNTGKSVFAKLLIAQLIKAGSPDLIRLILVDPKQVTFKKFQDSSHLACPIITQHYLLLPMLKAVLAEIEQRYKIFAEYNCENIEEYRYKTQEKLASYFLVIDEFADLLDSFAYKEKDMIEKILKRYGQMARAAGVHLILLTQRATSQNIPSELRANIGGRIAFRTNTEADSQFILEETGAEKLKYSGEFIIKKNYLDAVKAYCPLFNDDELIELLKVNKLKWPLNDFNSNIMLSLSQNKSPNF